VIWHTDTNKAFRCPRRATFECAGFVSPEETGWAFTAWHVYTCNQCGLRVARNPLLPGYPRAGDGYLSRVRWQFRRAALKLRDIFDI
jgi:hypothetical protein